MNQIRNMLVYLISSTMLLGTLASCKPQENKPTESSPTEQVQTSSESAQQSGTSTETAQQSEAATTTDGMRAILDDDGQEVMIPNKVKSCAVIGMYPLPSVIANYLGSGEKIIGMDAFALAAAENGLLGKLYPEILNAKTDFMDGDQLNIESLMALKPDVVFFSAKNDKQRQALASAGIPAIGVHAQRHGYNCIQTYNDWFELMNRVFPGEGPSGSEVTEYSTKTLENIQKCLQDIPEEKRVRALSIFRYTEDKLLVSGANFFGNWWIETTGGINVAKEAEGNGAQVVNMEQILKWNPEVIFITNFSGAQPEDLYENRFGGEDWSTIEAVKNKKVFKMPLGSYRTFTPGVDTPMTLLWTAKALYPEQFKDIDMGKEFKDYYKNLFNVDLTDEDVEQILHPVRAAAGKYQ